jgi:hypothetical protein
MKKGLLFIINFSFCACVIFLASCSDKPPVSEKNFVEVYVQLQLFEAQYASQPLVQKAKADSVLKAFNMNDSLVNSMLLWYSRKPERWDEFFGQVQKRMNEIKTAYVRQKH